MYLVSVNTGSIGHVQRVNLNDIIDKLECNLQLLTELGIPTSLTCIGDSFVITLSEQCIKVYETKYHTLQASIVVQDSIKQLSQVLAMHVWSHNHNISYPRLSFR